MAPIIPPNYANAIAPFSPLGRRAVGEEDTDLKRRASTLKALEKSAESAPGENRRSPDERAGEAGEQVRLSQSSLNQLHQYQAESAAEQPLHEVRRQPAPHPEPTYAAALERAAAREPDQSEADVRAELLRQQAQKLLQALQALRAMSPEAEVMTAESTDENSAALEEAAKKDAEQRALLQGQIDLSRRLIDQGIGAEAAPSGHKVSRRI